MRFSLSKLYVFTGLLSLLLSVYPAYTQVSTSDLPNIIYIFADDLGYGDLGCFGATDINTPHIDRIAHEGIQFNALYSASSVCSPSRAGLLTGRMPQRMGVNSVFFPESFTGMPTEEVTIAEMLKAKHYATGIIGKWHLGHHYQFLPLQQGFDEYFGIPYSNDMESVVYMRGNAVESFTVDQSQLIQTYTKEAVSFIRRHKNEPFFLYVAHNMPHVPIYASEAFLGTSRRGLYGDVVQELDWSVGKILKELEAQGLLENTLIVFSSDNGPWLVMEDHGGSAGKLREGKMYTFEGGMRVPTVAMWKGKIPAGTVHDGIASQMDWFPTIAQITDIPLTQNQPIDGVDISNILFEEGLRTDSTLLYFDFEHLQCYRKGEWKVKVPYLGFQQTRWKQGVAAHDTLLYNLKKDPGERNNLFHKHKSLAISLLQEMSYKYQQMGALPPSLSPRKPADESHFTFLKKKKNKPNLFLFLADDLSKSDLGITGNPYVKTPAIDDFASNSVSFTRMYTPSAMCAPSRSALLTGLYPHRNGCHMNHGKVYDEVKSIPTYLKPLGYKVAIVGKGHIKPRKVFSFDWVAPDSLDSYLARVSPPVCVIFASHEPHGPHKDKTHSPDSVLIPPKWLDTKITRRSLAGYYADIALLDREFEAFVKTIRKHKLYNNSLIAFTSDHGYEYFAKWSCYEAGIQVPFYLQAPGMDLRTEQVDALTSFVDIVPTWIVLAGGTPPTELDGKSMLPLLEKKQPAIHEHIYAAHTTRGVYSGKSYPIRSITDGKWKYIRNLNYEARFQNIITHGRNFNAEEAAGSWKEWQQARERQANGAEWVTFYQSRPYEELYNLATDPEEMHNLAMNPEFAAHRTRLSDQLSKWMGEQGDTGVQAELAVPLKVNK